MNLERANWTLKEGRDWHVGWFRESLKLIDTFTHQESWRGNVDRFKGGTNLCHYVRVSALWGPGILFLHLLTLSLIMGAVFFMPLKAFGVLGYILMWFIVAFAAGFVFGLIKFVEWADSTSLGRRIGDWLENALLQPARDVRHATAEKLTFRSPEGVSFWSMVWTNIITLKHQVCPLIQIKEDE